MLKHTCSLENVLLCLLKSLCHFRQNLIHMFLILFLKHITMFCRTRLKFTTFRVTLSHLSIKQEVTFPIRARIWPSEKRRCVLNPTVHVVYIFPPLSWKPQPSNNCPLSRIRFCSISLSSDTLFRMQYSVLILFFSP